MKTLGRRLFAKATMGAPLALSAPQNVPSISGGMPLGGPPVQFGAGAQLSMVDKIWRAIRVATRPEREKESTRYVRRQMMGGLDPDLAVLNSMSHARRVAIQIDREKAALERQSGLRAKIIIAMGGKPEDFE